VAIPNYEQIMTPFLNYINNDQEHKLADIKEKLAGIFKLTDKEKATFYPSGNNLIFNNRVQWARLYLLKAGLLESSNRGLVRITSRGKKVLTQYPEISLKVLQQFPEYREFKNPSLRPQKEFAEVSSYEDESKTPQDSMEESYLSLRQNLAKDLLTQVKTCSPIFFEKLVLQLLKKMGYGIPQDTEERWMTPKTKDGGIDGRINQDLLGLDIIYVQAKRWENPISDSQVRDFIGSVKINGANKGVFITTSHFSSDALKSIEKVGDYKIIPIDGNRLVEYMIDYDIGVNQINSYAIKKVDEDYFDEE